ncbi:MAG: MucR family transcriptional regulator [Micavibrio aeruginosavorus]|uniref:MucR family transcriptional regulator n=1 Tax=Micavibrio aeruginosavorus TaxID=349221 RepID=A0A2W5FNA4_9BACT|nr:MAG: MucR family transcriptional regulator [Micavibrio aeruginosavorus]
MAETNKSNDILALTTEIVSAHLSNNTVPAGEIPALIERIYKTLSGVGGELSASNLPAERPQPAVPIRKSVMPEYIVCLEDGKKLKMLKRHLKTAYKMTPEQYRERWGLPADYPMVAPSYAKTRSRLAKDIGLGTKGRSERKKK